MTPISSFAQSLVDHTDLVENNALRLDVIARWAHDKLSQFDNEQLRELASLEFGPGLLMLADRYAEVNHGLRDFKEWIDGSSMEK